MEWTPPPNGIAMCQSGVWFNPLEEEASMEQVSMIGIDLAGRTVRPLMGRSCFARNCVLGFLGTGLRGGDGGLRECALLGPGEKLGHDVR